jgi:hypothetical protein
MVVVSRQVPVALGIFLNPTLQKALTKWGVPEPCCCPWILEHGSPGGGGPEWTALNTRGSTARPAENTDDICLS